jgi:hypothetical protein
MRLYRSLKNYLQFDFKNREVYAKIAMDCRILGAKKYNADTNLNKLYVCISTRLHVSFAAPIMANICTAGRCCVKAKVF